MPATHTVTRLSADDLHAEADGLAELLADAVEGGDSLGFLAPFDQEQAAAWWLAQRAAVEEGGLAVWAARSTEGVVGTVGLALSAKPNARHRAEVVKLMVRRDARGRGLARLLLATAEQAAADAGVELLLLDTETGSAAENLYLSAGWTRFGIVPDYAAEPGGRLRDCSFYFKRLT
ncbi:GNAT superfamily N-acetyltransferase [Spinactinospora alkalitolerans]|uniref:GNAT superfamily N-acetyltransferase n=1 Tax=Spinactinospora alkalitolerans TaxID=687207 RepID=A0A852U0F7_9ACTN|nr:GNAT family N-acetyltransferase [Spinactinospora alkalitolerans]NYE47500.1 GNAT superfamily N-acetyltransferase [Spinactinospora alkalitolerans]